MDLIIRNARLVNGALTDIAVEDGVIARLEPHLTLSAAQEFDAGEGLTLPAFVNGQLHSCKSFWRRHLQALPPELQALPRFEAARVVKRRYTLEDVANRVDEAVRLAVLNGSCALRLFADVDGEAGLTALEGLIDVKRHRASVLPLQVTAFPQDGMRSASTERLMEEALARGADVVGGIPWVEEGEAQDEHTEMCFNLARRFGKPLHFVADDTTDPESNTLEGIARKTIDYGLQGQVCVTQCTSLAFQDDAYAAKVIALLKEAGITVFCNAHVSLVTTGDSRAPYPRGITRVRELLAAGVPVACAQDDIDNPYYPFGRNDLLEVALFMAHAGAFAWNGEVNRVLPMVTTTPACALGLTDYGLESGKRADLVVLGAPDWHSALQFQADKRFVILGGRLRAITRRQHECFF